MKANLNRSFNCKNEELPVVCRFGALSLARDLNDFAAYSPVFNANYLASFETKIETVQELVQPRSETVELKTITERLYQTLDGIVDLVNRLGGYLRLAGKQQIPVSAADFGLTKLRKSARSRDVENVLAQLTIVEGNIGKYQTPLKAKGLTDGFVAKIAETSKSVTADKQRKYALISNRAAVVQNNMALLNELSNQLSEICKVGKILYRQSDKAKLKDFTFAQLRKQVRKEAKANESIPNVVAAT